MIGHTIIIKLVLQSKSFEKKSVKPLKNCFFGPNLYRKEVIVWAMPKMEKFFLAEIKKADHQLSVFILSKYHVLSYESFSILSDVFCQKTVISAKTAVMSILIIFIWQRLLIAMDIAYKI